MGHAQGKDVNPLHKIALESQVFYPITFPISIGPGSVSVILTLMASVSMKDGWAKGLLSYAIIALVIVLMCLILYLFLSQGENGSSAKSATAAASSSTRWSPSSPSASASRSS